MDRAAERRAVDESATGEFDSLVNDNRNFSALLSSRGVPNRCEIWPGVFGHDWPWWNENVRRFY